jgi:hypothetical protein
MKVIFIILITIFILILVIYLIIFQLIPYINKKSLDRIISNDSKNNDIDMKMELGSAYTKTINVEVPLLFNRNYKILATFANSDGKIIPDTYASEGKLFLNITVTEKDTVIATSNFNNNYWKIETLATKDIPGTITLTPDPDLINATEVNLGITTIIAKINNPVQYTKNYVRLKANYSSFFSFDDVIERIQT